MKTTQESSNTIICSMDNAFSTFHFLLRSSKFSMMHRSIQLYVWTKITFINKTEFNNQNYFISMTLFCNYWQFGIDRFIVRMDTLWIVPTSVTRWNASTSEPKFNYKQALQTGNGLYTTAKHFVLAIICNCVSNSKRYKQG